MTIDYNLYICYIIFTYGAYSSAVERQIVDLVVVGSIPTRHPKGVSGAYTFFNAPVAHLDRATDFESVGSTFESCQAHGVFFKIFL